MPSECSTCVPVAGFAQNCQLKQPGGNQPLLLFVPACQIDTDGITYDAYDPNIVTAIPLKPGYVWFSVQAVKDSVLGNTPFVSQQRMGNTTVQFNIQNYGFGADYVEAASAHKAFIDGLWDSQDPMVFVEYDRRGVGYVYGLPWGLEIQDSDGIQRGAVQTDPSVTTFIYTGLLDSAPFPLAAGISLPTA